MKLLKSFQIFLKRFTISSLLWVCFDLILIIAITLLIWDAVLKEQSFNELFKFIK